jgi:hypothetical protein
MAGIRVGAGSRIAVGVAMTGDKEMLAKLVRLASDKGIRKQLRVATLEVAESMVELMKFRTPVKTGKLMRSERALAMVSPKKEDVRVTMVAGGVGIEYAQRVHENLTAKHPGGGQAKYMESVLLESAPTAGREIAIRIDLKDAAGA